MLVLWILIELGTVNSISMAVVRRIGFFEFQHLLPLHLIIETNHWLTSSSDELGPVNRVVQAVELLITGVGVILERGEQLARSEMPVLNLSFCVGSGEDVPGLKVVVLWSPKDIRKRSFGLIADGISKTLLLDIEDLHSTVLAG